LSELGRVLRSTGSWYDVEVGEGRVVACRTAGKLRLAGDRSTNPVAVGDRVAWSPEGDGQGVITSIAPRRNAIVRRSVNLSRATHVVAANLDHAWLVLSCSLPETATGFVDRFLVAAHAFGVEVTILFNKWDEAQGDPGRVEALEYLEDVYATAGYRTLRLSARTGAGVVDWSAELTGGVHLVSGPSGVGKSSLINRLLPGVELRTAAISGAHAKGRHTTTFAEMFPLPGGGYIIDTPGIKGFGLVDIERETLHHHFPEMFALLPHCKFHNCTHQHEPQCAVRAGVETGEVPQERYANYLDLFTHFEADGWRK
jgi:ribosome biogenesis GTPase